MALGGTQWFLGQHDGQTMKYGRRGVERSQIGGLGPTEVIGNHHQRVVFGVVPAVNRAILSPAAGFGAKWGPLEKC